MKWRSKDWEDFFMGLCFSCKKPSSKNQNLSEEKTTACLNSSAIPLDTCYVDEHNNSSTVVSLESSSTSGPPHCQHPQQFSSKMANPVKVLVSKRKKRYTQDGFNLDLTYITDNIIAMGFPAEKLEGVFRNHISDVKRLLDSKHSDHYKIYNLCSEKKRSYDPTKFYNRVATYPFDDHNPPKIELIGPFCKDVHEWISSDDKNVAVVHCKAGKGRTGVMICCYMIHSGQFSTSQEALSYYGLRRTHDRKGVTIPSQRRYVDYYAQIIDKGLEYKPVTLLLEEIRLDPLPHLNGMQGNVSFTISDLENKIFASTSYEVKKNNLNSLCLRLPNLVQITGDVKLEFYSKNAIRQKEKLFHFWINTFFVKDEVKPVNENGNQTAPPERTNRAMSCEEQPRVPSNIMSRQNRTSSLVSMDGRNNGSALYYTIDKWNLDDAHKDKQNKNFPADFKVTMIMLRDTNCDSAVSENIRQLQECASGSSEGDQTSSDSSTDEEDDEEEAESWESGESTHL